MSQILAVGQKVRAESTGLSCEVLKFLGGGGQGEVYAARMGGKQVALKWYYNVSATSEQRVALETLCAMGAPSPKFLWPLELASASGVADYGYVMSLREARYKSIVDMMKRRIEPSFRALATAGLELSHSFLQLHARGLCYRDISFGNAFFDPDTGEVLICDNDNVAVDGQEGGIYGTPRFMAPEVVRGDAAPSSQTDLFSLSVLLFYMFMMHHPLEGKRELAIKCLDLPAMRKLYGTEPIFIFDPLDDSNAPDPTYQRNALVFWSIYPEFLRELFTKAFTEGVRDPSHGRVRESEWRAAMVRLRDSIIYCGHCKAESFYDADAHASASGNYSPCWSCRRPLHPPPRLRIARSEVMLNHDTHLFPHHVDDERRYDFTQPLAAVTPHPTEPSIWGLKNLSRHTWSATNQSGEVKDVGPGRSVTLAVGTRINFGRAEGEITF